MLNGSMAIAVPCHGWEDFPSHYRGREATQILTSWTALWHPKLLGFAGALPTWRHFSGSSATAPCVLVVPQIADVPKNSIPTEGPKAYFLDDNPVRNEMVENLCDTLEIPNCEVPADLVATFYALGYATLQVQLMTRQMRHSCSLDEERFATTTLEAAQAALRGDAEQARSKIQSGFDQLAQERDHYYAVDVFLLEIILATPATTGPKFKESLLDGGAAKNLMLTGETLDSLSRTDPDCLTMMRHQMEHGRLALVGGEPFEARLPLLPADDMLEHFRAGAEQFRAAVGEAPQVFGRRAFGLCATLPELLKRCGYRGAVHFTLDDGKFPNGNQAKTTWQGTSGATVDAIGRLPADAAAPETFLYLATQLSQSMDSDHVATALLAYWPGQQNPWLQDLRKATEIHPVLGRFVTVDEYLERSSYMGHYDRHSADAYRSPYLAQDIATRQTHPITNTVPVWEQWRQRLANQHVKALTHFVAGRAADARENIVTSNLLPAFSVAIANPRNPVIEAGWIAVNPFALPRRTLVELPGFQGQSLLGDYVVASGRQSDRFYAVVDVPSCGFTWLPAANHELSSDDQVTPLNVADGYTLRNEFMQVTIDSKTGGFSSLRDYHHRDNLLSQQLAARQRFANVDKNSDESTGDQSKYSRMIADSVRVTSTGPVWGSIESQGRLVDDQARAICRFRQRATLWRGSRTVWFDIELIPVELLELEASDHPWDNYIAFRLAWKDAGAVIHRDLHMTRQLTELSRMEAPGYLDLQCGKRRATLLCGGIPYHRLSGERMLDTLLVAGHEQTRQFRLGISLDSASPWQEYLSGPEGEPFSEPTTSYLTGSFMPNGQPRGWLLHVDARNVWMSGLTPIIGPNEECIGFRTRLLETEGRTATARVSAFRPIKEGRILDLAGKCECAARIDDGALVTTMGSNEWMEVEAYWT